MNPNLEHACSLQTALLPLAAVEDQHKVKFDLVQTSTALKQSEFESCFQLIKTTSGADYAGSSVGWNPASKRQEMSHLGMMFLLVRPCELQLWQAGESQDASSASSDILGFMSFMYDHDDPPNEDRPVIYIYEVHLEDQLRGKGLGTALINFAERAARAAGISKTMLTVFTSNAGARALYERLGYERDECSPKDRITRHRTIEADYVILSKELV